jgi:hypothetical protein
VRPIMRWCVHGDRSFFDKKRAGPCECWCTRPSPPNQMAAAPVPGPGSYAGRPLAPDPVVRLRHRRTGTHDTVGAGLSAAQALSSRPPPGLAFTRTRRGMATPARPARCAPDMPRRALCEGRAPLGICGHMGADGDGRVGS